MKAHRFTNHLISETSPYLLQHAHNPVNWHVWGKEAFEKAKREDKPILVSIGYAACHWCHVMEHESFEDEKTAEFMNKFFVNIKVDREERPDVDHIYMQACQLITGSGGWPLNMFLTPDLKPFTGGTYFPLKPYYGKPSWTDVLVYVHEVFSRERDKAEEQAELMMQHLQKMDDSLIQNLQIKIAETEILSKSEIQTVHKNLAEHFDTEDGGFGNSPKFPSAMTLLYMLKKNYFTKNEKELQFIHLTLYKMFYGGIYDHIGGGFARYSVDKKWIVPHFEKMLYDNALLVKLYAEAFMLFGDDEYRRMVKETLDFVIREMLTEEGGFYSSFDADSEGEEGTFYTWQKEEIEKILGDDAAFFCKVFHVEEIGNWEHKNILYKEVIHNTDGQFGKLEDEQKAKIESCKNKLFLYREKRIKPALDDKIILSWNALMCSAFVSAYRATANNIYIKVAEKNLKFLLKSFSNPNKNFHFFHTYKNGITKYPAMLEDYASLIAALLDVYEITGNILYIEEAIALNEFVNENFSDENKIHYYFTEKNQADIPMRNKEMYDHATPSGNAIQFFNLHKLAIITGNKKLSERADTMFLSLKRNIINYPTSFGAWLTGSLHYTHPILETVISGREANKKLLEILSVYYPNQIIMLDENGELSDYPLLKERFQPNVTRIFNCRNYNCQLPVISKEEYVNQLQAFCSEINLQ
ncbi:MAG: thioredoxin domain-containing protein [Chitinophagales bacterium]